MNDQTDIPGDYLNTMPVILPSSPPVYKTNPPTSLTSAILDTDGISRLLGALLSHSGLSVTDAALRLGLTRNAVRAYTSGNRPNPTLRTFLRLVDLLGARVWVEWPTKRDHNADR